MSITDEPIVIVRTALGDRHAQRSKVQPGRQSGGQMMCGVMYIGKVEPMPTVLDGHGNRHTPASAAWPPGMCRLCKTQVLDAFDRLLPD